MNFHGLQKIEKGQFYVDLAMRKARERANNAGKLKGDKLNINKTLALLKVRTLGGSLDLSLKNIVQKFPSLDDLPEFYNELCSVTFSLDKAKQALGRLDGARQQIKTLIKSHGDSLKRAQTITQLETIRGSCYGRVASVVKKIQASLVFLDACRRTMKTFPVVKTGCYTVCLAGFPNVGKSTLLAKITGAKPAIANYEFTTKSLNMGYLQGPYGKIQCIDAPGTLARFEKQNIIEQQAELALKYLTHLIIFVVDPTETRPLVEQKKLYKIMVEYDKPLIVYVSKSDLVEPEDVERTLVAIGAKGLSNTEELIEKIITSSRQN